MKVKVTCWKCRKDYVLEMTESQYDRLVKGKELIQSIFPEFTPAQRELLISNTCDSCWHEMYSTDESEDEYDDEEIMEF